MLYADARLCVPLDLQHGGYLDNGVFTLSIALIRGTGLGRLALLGENGFTAGGYLADSVADGQQRCLEMSADTS